MPLDPFPAHGQINSDHLSFVRYLHFDMISATISHLIYVYFCPRKVRTGACSTFQCS